MKKRLLLSALFLCSCDAWEHYQIRCELNEKLEKEGMFSLEPEEVYPDSPDSARTEWCGATIPSYAGKVLPDTERTALLQAMQQATHVVIETTEAVSNTPWEEKTTTSRQAPKPLTPAARAHIARWATAPQWVIMQFTPFIDIIGYFNNQTSYIFTDAQGNELGRLDNRDPYYRLICKPERQKHYAHMAKELKTALEQ
ncbi:MAG: hypothetical protein Q4F38_06775 [Akkermansia sp.]|nr:hypothetical protein [Akkermansia sp.]